MTTNVAERPRPCNNGEELLFSEWKPQRQHSKAVDAPSHQGARPAALRVALPVDPSYLDGNCGRRRAVAPYAIIAAINPPMPSNRITRLRL